MKFKKTKIKHCVEIFPVKYLIAEAFSKYFVVKNLKNKNL